MQVLIGCTFRTRRASSKYQEAILQATPRVRIGFIANKIVIRTHALDPMQLLEANEPAAVFYLCVRIMAEARWRSVAFVLLSEAAHLQAFTSLFDTMFSPGNTNPFLSFAAGLNGSSRYSELQPIQEPAKFLKPSKWFAHTEALSI